MEDKNTCSKPSKRSKLFHIIIPHSENPLSKLQFEQSNLEYSHKERRTTMKQKIVLKVTTMTSPKSRSKAMKVAVGVAGVDSAAIQGDEKNQIVVTGEGIDSVVLTVLLRKQIGFTELVSVGPVEAEKKKEEVKVTDTEPLPNQYYYQYGVPAAQYHSYPYEPYNNSNSFMW